MELFTVSGIFIVTDRNLLEKGGTHRGSSTNRMLSGLLGARSYSVLQSERGKGGGGRQKIKCQMRIDS